MAIFKKADDKKGSPSPRERAGAAMRLNPNESAISIIGPGMRIQGDISTDGTVRVEGSVEGTIQAGKAVVLGKEGEIRGNVLTQDAVIGGRVIGTIIAESRLELQSTSVIEGEIRARAEHLQLDEGARFNGQIQMIDGDEPPRPETAPARPGPETETPPETASETTETTAREAEKPRGKSGSKG
jgi:cytoskeletal protein CcmA (bactofilin family)